MILVGFNRTLLIYNVCIFTKLSRVNHRPSYLKRLKLVIKNALVRQSLYVRHELILMQVCVCVWILKCIFKSVCVYVRKRFICLSFILIIPFIEHNSHWKERKLKTWKSPDARPGRHKIHQSSLSFRLKWIIAWSISFAFGKLLVPKRELWTPFTSSWSLVIGTIVCRLAISIMSTSLK